MKDDNEAFKGSPYLTSTRGRTPPLVTSDFVVQDDGKWTGFSFTVAITTCTEFSVVSGRKVPYNK